MSINTSFSNGTVLGVYNHPGGENSIFPVLTELQNRNIRCFCVSEARGIKRCKDAGIPSSEIIDRITEKKAEECFNLYNPHVVLCGTSEPEDPVVGRLESLFTKVARAKSIPAVAVLDHWCGYKDRFSLSNSGLLDALPNIICVMDKTAQEDMIKLGFPKDILHVTGNPHCDVIIGKRYEFDRLDRNKIRKNIGIKENEHIVLFVSEPLFEDHGGDRGYTEFQVLRDVQNALAANSKYSNVVVWIKLHPREKIDKFNHMILNADLSKFRIIRDEMDVYHLAKAVDVIVGMTSMLLIEYSLLGIPVISFQPIAVNKIKVHMGYGVIPVHNNESLVNILNNSLTLSKTVRKRVNISINATQKVISILADIVERKAA